MVAEEIGEDVPGWARGNERFNPPPRRTTPPKTPSNAGARTPEKTRFGSQAPANTPPEKKEYRYRDEKGVERWRVVRCDWPGYVDETTGKPKKTFKVGRVVDGEFVEGLNGEKVPPYNLPELINPACRYVCVVEGDKCADAVNKFLGEYFETGKAMKANVATTLPNGAQAVKRWGEYVDYLRGKANVFIFADNDEPGYKAARTIAKILTDAEIGAKVVVFGSVERDGETLVFKRPGRGEVAPEKYDVADFLKDVYACTKDLEGSEQRQERGRLFDDLLTGSFVFDASFFARQEEKAPNAENARVDALDDENEETGEGDEDDVTDAEEENAAQEGREAARRRAELNRRRKEAEEAPEVPDGLDLYPITDFAKDCARVRGVPEAAYLATAFAVLGAAVGRRFLLDEPEQDRRGTLLNICAFLFGEPGVSKSDVLKDAVEPLEKIQREYDAEFCDGRRERQPLILVGDCTPEAVRRAMKANEKEGVLNGILARIDEGTKHFASYGVGASSRDTARNIELVEGNLGASIRSDETKGVVLLKKSAFSVIGGVQPKAFVKSLRDNEAVESQGYIHRFQWVNIPWNDDTQRETAPPDADIRAQYANVVKKIAAFGEEKRLTFSKEARGELRRVRAEFDTKTKSLRNRGATTLGTYWRKSHKTLAQLAALLHVVRWATGEEREDESDSGPTCEISADAVKTAAGFARLFNESFEGVLNVLHIEETGAVKSAFYDKYEQKTLDAIERLQGSGEGATKTTLVRAVAYFRKPKGAKRRNEILQRLLLDGIIVRRGTRYYLAEQEEDGE